MIKLTLRIKFRAFFVDLLKIERVFDVDLGVPPVYPPYSSELLNERGVYLKVEA
jgi:hypothetical protein